jgi:penicillin amidase
MRTLKRILTIVLIVIVLALAGGMIFLNSVKTRAIPDYNASVDLDDLTGTVTVYRDSLGIPHIYAENEEDLYRTVGYVMAQDRLWQMDLLRRVTTGRLSEVLDPGLVETDRLFRALNFTGKSRKVMAQTDPEIVRCIEAYTDGINQYINRNQKNLSFEFTMLGYKPEPWKVEHSFNLIGYMAWDLSSGWNTDMALYKIQQLVSDTLFNELIPDLKYQDIPVIPDYMSSEHTLELKSAMTEVIGNIEELGLQIFEASNNWAVSGKKSETGAPLMANDMHLGLNAPGIWYQMHLVIAGDLNVTGVALPGAPFIVAGHNEDIGWGFTNVTVDDLDFYLETINPADSNQYLLDGEWQDMRIVKEEIPVKGNDEPVIRINRFTHRGPVVSEFKGVKDKVISAHWQGNEMSNEVRTVYLLNRAGNWEDFRDALKTFTSVSQNVVYADRFGNIGLQVAAGVPIRHSGGILVYPGDTSLYDWQGVVPFEELPYSFNPERGYVSSANNKTVDESYPYYIGTWYSLPWRIGRIREMLEEKEVLGTEDFKRMQRDQNSLFARKMTPVYLAALEGQISGEYEQAYRALADWDYNMQSTSSVALIFDFMFLELNRAMFQDELGKDYRLLAYNPIADNLIEKTRVTGKSLWCDNVDTPDKTESFQDNIRTAFRSTVDTITSMYGPEVSTWEWGNLHQFVLMHPLGSVPIIEKLFKVNRGPYPVGGSYHTVCPFSYPRGRSFISDFGASERHIFNTAKWDQSLTVIPTGTSGVPASPHYLDQTQLYINNRYHSDHFSREAVEENSLYMALFQ